MWKEPFTVASRSSRLSQCRCHRCEQGKEVVPSRQRLRSFLWASGCLSKTSLSTASTYVVPLPKVPSATALDASLR